MRQANAPDVAFLLAHTHPARAPLVPEIAVYLSQQVVPLWQATEQRSGSQQSPPFWAFAWPGSQVLARWVLDHPRLVRGKRVLDFAAGGGLAGLAAAHAGAAHVVACDLEPLAAVVQQLNARLNRLAIESVVADLVGTEPDADVVLAGDVCYDRLQSPRIAGWLRRLAPTRTVLLADPGRAYAPTDKVCELALFVVPTLEDLESAPMRTTRLLRLLPG